MCKNLLMMTLLTLFFLFVILSCENNSTESNVNVPILIRQVDHILIASSEVEELFSLLSDTFQFPVAWPIADYGGSASGGVAVGNVNIEIYRVSASADSVVRSRFEGFALEPEPLESSLLELDARKIAYEPPAPYISTESDGSTTTLWTTVELPDVSNDAMWVFLCEYTHDVAASRQLLLEQLQSRDGGPLSVESVREIVCGTTDLNGSRDHWQRLLNPLLPSSPDVWQLGAGPAIRLIQADEDGIQELVINVSSLAQARRFLKEHGLLGTDSPDELTMDSSRLQGLNIRLVETD